MSSSQHQIDQWIASEKARQARDRQEFFSLLYEDLSKVRFRRSGQVFRRSRGDDTQILDFEPYHGAFRLNLGVYYPDLVTIFSDGEEVPLDASKCRAWQCLIGDYLSHIDTTVAEASGYDPSTVSEWIDVLHGSAIPWLERASLPTYSDIKTRELRASFTKMWRLRRDATA